MVQLAPENATENTTDTTVPEVAAAQLRSTVAVRARATELLDRARRGESEHFAVDDAALAGAARLVAEVTRRNYPDLTIPYHSRWRHFEAENVDRTTLLRDRLATMAVADRARSMIDLTVVSVLLDAGAGPDWTFRERSGVRLSRSEGLGVASWHAFVDGLFSSDPTNPLRVDAAALRSIDADGLGAAFQVTPDNPLVGLAGRARLLNRLGDQLDSDTEVFGDQPRPGGLVDLLTADHRRSVAAQDILGAVLTHLSPIWLTGNAIDEVALGDCWRHSAVGGDGLTAGWVPFHKLSQWLTYSLLEPFEWSGIEVTGLDALTGLPEYRNGGLLLDSGVLSLVDPAAADADHRVGDELVVEWRALTVALLDELAPLVCGELGLDESSMPLACVLEGGTWAAGRQLAGQRRKGLPPLTIVSDGTVF